MRSTRVNLLLVLALMVFTTIAYAQTYFARLECNRHGAGDDRTHWAINFDEGSEPQIGPNSHIFLKVRRPTISPDDVAYNIIIRNISTGAEYYQIAWWQKMTSTDWFIWAPRFSGIDDSDTGTTITTPWIQPCISDWDDGSADTGYIYYDIAEIRIGPTWDTATPIPLRDSTSAGLNANRWYFAWTNVNWLPRFPIYHPESPGFATLGTKQINMGGDNTNWWDQNFVPFLPGSGYSLYLRYRLSPDSEAPANISERGLDVNGWDFEFTDGWWTNSWNTLYTHEWRTHEFPCPSTVNIQRIGIGVSDTNDGDTSSGLILVDIDRVVWAPSGYGTDIDAAAADSNAVELQHRDYHPNTTSQPLSDFYDIWVASPGNFGYASWQGEVNYARLGCERHGAGDDRTHWMHTFDPPGPQCGPNSHIFWKMRRAPGSPNDVCYRFIICDDATGTEYWGPWWWQLTDENWSIYQQTFTGVDDPAGTTITLRWIQVSESDWDDGSPATGTLYIDIAEIRIGPTWDTATPIVQRDSSSVGTIANHWYINWSGTGMKNPYPYLESSSPDYVKLGTKQVNMPGDNTQYFGITFNPPLAPESGGSSFYLHYRLDPTSEAPAATRI
ncbi:hypothetical protein J7M23_00845, partial [Candidatus Sumerlaeota bacterium]|nr:hypothetical protein [Candidatus Sumerlaeota bacterium]